MIHLGKYGLSKSSKPDQDKNQNSRAQQTPEIERSDHLLSSQEPDNFNYDPTKVLEWTGTVAGSDTLSGRGQKDDHFADVTESIASEHPTDDRGNQMAPCTSTTTTEEERSPTEKNKTPHEAKVKSGPSADQEETKQGSVMPLSVNETVTDSLVSIMPQSSQRPRAWASLFQSTLAPCAASTAGTSASVNVRISSTSGACSAKEAAGTSNETQPNEVEKIEDQEGEFVTVTRGKRQSRKSTDQHDHQYAEEVDQQDVFSYDEIDVGPKCEDWYLDKELALQNASFTRTRYGVNPNRQASSKKWDLDDKTHWGRGFR
ncbi:hypothetical protein V866_003361 [Kwoniella sp. B9012]|uniref:Uncharacterized protein n=1 Tax=Kwoniella europaea PYCC6329 TaxID=1423913 RepID=A0AAX4KFH2_9TREE